MLLATVEVDSVSRGICPRLYPDVERQGYFYEARLKWTKDTGKIYADVANVDFKEAFGFGYIRTVLEQ